MHNISLNDLQLKKIYETLQKGDRVELIPLKEGVKIIKIRREEIKPNV